MSPRSCLHLSPTVDPPRAGREDVTALFLSGRERLCARLKITREWGDGLLGRVAFGLIVVLAAAAAAGAAVPLLSPLVIDIPDDYHTGGAYTAIQAAPDGRVYLGTTVYEGYGRLLVLPPGSREFQVITDMAAATGETKPGPNAQAKIHTKPVVAPDGKVYFGTKSGLPAERAVESGYSGGHLLVYDPQTRRVTDLGIPRPRQSIISVGVDGRRYIVYVLTDPEGHLITYDPRARTFADRGEFAAEFEARAKGTIRRPTRYLVVLGSGDAFHPAGPDGLMRYNATAGRIERLPLQFSGAGRYESPYALASSADGGRFHGVGRESGQVYTFTPGAQAVGVQLQGAAIPEGFAPPGVHYTMTAGPDGNVYYTAQFGSSFEALFIQRLQLPAGRPEVVGRVGTLPPAPQSRWRPARVLIVQGSTVAPDGTFYIMTAYPLRVLVFPRIAAGR